MAGLPQAGWAGSFQSVAAGELQKEGTWHRPLAQASLTVRMPCAERELLLLKVQAPPGQQRTEILQLADIFRARVVDCGDASLTLCATGDAGRVCVLSGPAFSVLRVCAGSGARVSLPGSGVLLWLCAGCTACMSLRGLGIGSGTGCVH